MRIFNMGFAPLLANVLFYYFRVREVSTSPIIKLSI